MPQTYNVAIGKTPNIIRRTAREVAGDTVLGFGLTIVPFDSYRHRIACDLLYAGQVNAEIIHACLDTMAKTWGVENVAGAVTAWLHEIARLEGRDVVVWPPFQCS